MFNATTLFKFASLFKKAADVIDFGKFKHKKDHEGTSKQRMAFFRAAKSGWLDFSKFDEWRDNFPLLFSKHFSYAITEAASNFLIEKNIVENEDPAYSPSEKEISGAINFLLRRDPLGFVECNFGRISKRDHD